MMMMSMMMMILLMMPQGRSNSLLYSGVLEREQKEADTPPSFPLREQGEQKHPFKNAVESL